MSLCECGCGQETKIANKTHASRNQIKDRPMRFVHGHNRRRPYAERFWEKIRVGSADECWPWLAGMGHKGYGHFEGHTASHVAYELTNGPLSDGLIACHTCNNPPCCNPAHLYAGTYADNAHDAIHAGTFP
jgi:hypothetical protein